MPYDFSVDPDAGMPAPPSFTPVPMLRNRRGGWTPGKQRAFIAALCQWGSVGRAAQAVGMSARSAYRLLDRDGCESFARAWDKAVDHARERARADSLDRALHGHFVPVYRKGRLVRVEHRHNTRLAVALLSNQTAHLDKDVAYEVRNAAQIRADNKAVWRTDAAILGQLKAIREARAMLAEAEALAAQARHRAQATRGPRISGI
ncbi:hypothetical protein [Sphingomonas sp. ASV193]|uniref:hypothetical protein n=1 Tax=Sphingomonas sp. ASV193 TaxID=3144405 RepID=UPI0032E8E827